MAVNWEDLKANGFKVYVIIPAYNEEKSIGLVINDIPKKWIEKIIVINNNSTDKTGVIAKSYGAIVYQEPKQGYGYACLTGIAYLKKMLSPSEFNKTIVVFLDGDYSDYPSELPELVLPILKENKDMVIGSRALGQSTKDAMLPHQQFGNWLATRLIALFYKANFTDLGPFRSIRFNKLISLNMQDKTYGWTVEMQVKALKHGLAWTEIPVSYKKRIGISKVSGTLKGSILAGYKILWIIFKTLLGL